jgi:TrmH family RNA methyltransferase
MNALDNISIVLVEPANPGNIGATARVLKNTGLSRLILVNPGAWDTPETRWMAHGSEEILEACEIHPDLPSAIAQAHFVIGATHRLGRFRDVISTPREAITKLAPKAYHCQIAVVFGREKDGLWRSELLHCHQLVRFPSAVSYPSLNLSHAVLLFAYEFFHVLKPVPSSPPANLSTAADRERLYAHIGEAMEAIDFRPYNDDPNNFAHALRRFFNRVPLEKRDAMVIHKICGQIRKFAARHRASSPS